MDFLFSLPAFVKIGSCFAILLILNRFKLALGWAVVVAALLLTFSTGAGADGFVYLARSVVAPQNFFMVIVIVMLTFFSDALSHTGRMEKAVDAFRGIFKDRRLLMGGLPSIIGLLPMPGGALFSAPFLASVDEKHSLSAEQKSAVNYWFRHIWEYWWPLYPGVILALQYSGLPFILFLLIQLPFTAASVIGGYFFMLRPFLAGQGTTNGPRLSRRKAFQTLWPIGLLVALSVTSSAILPRMGISVAMANLYGMMGALVITLAFIFKSDFRALKKSLSHFAASSTWHLALVIAGVLAFSAILQMPLDASSHSLVSLMRDEFLRSGISIVFIMILIPFISGFVTGISAGFVGASFPLVFALLGNNPPLHSVMAVTSLSYAAGYLGIMLSPVHLCFIMSNDYFKAKMVPVYRYLLGPCAVIALAAGIFSTVYFYLFR